MPAWTTFEPKKESHNKPIRGLSFSPDGHYLACGSDDATLSLWDVTTRKFIKRRRPKEHKWGFTTLAFTRDSRKVVAIKASVVGKNKGLSLPVLWDLVTDVDAVLGSHQASLGARYESIDCSPMDKLIALAGGSVDLFDSDSGTLKAHLPQPGPYAPVAFGIDGTLAAATDGGFAIWDVQALKQLRSAKSESVDRLAYIGSAAPLAAVTSSLNMNTARKVQAWNEAGAVTGSVTIEKRVWEMSFIPGKRDLLLLEDDGTLSQWTLSPLVRKRELATKPAITAMAISRDGKSVAIGDENGKLRLCALDSIFG